MDDVHHFGSKTKIHGKNNWNLKHRGRRKVMNLGGGEHHDQLFYIFLWMTFTTLAPKQKFTKKAIGT